MVDQDRLRHSQLLNRLVIDYDTTEAIGLFDTFLVEAKPSQITGIICKTGRLGHRKQTFAWSQVLSIGNDSILIRTRPAADRPPDSAAQEMIGLEVWTDSGDKAGHVADYLFDLKTGAVTLYLFQEGLRELTEGLYGLSPEAILSVGRRRMMVAADALAQAEIYAAGLNQRAAQAADFLKSDYEQTRQDWSVLKQGAQTWLGKLQRQTQKLSEYTQENLPELTEQLQEKTQGVRDQMRQRVDQLKDRLQQTGLTPPGDALADQPDTLDIEAFEVWEEDPAAAPEPGRDAGSTGSGP
jgi:uncharacterized protein YrrD